MSMNLQSDVSTSKWPGNTVGLYSSGLVPGAFASQIGAQQPPSINDNRSQVKDHVVDAV